MSEGRPPTKGERTRERLVIAAGELIAARGYHAVGMSDIGARAGVTAAAIYRYFPGKSEILAAVSKGIVDELVEAARPLVDGSIAPEAALDELLAMHLDFAARRRQLIVVYNREGRHLPESQRREVRRSQRAYAALWTSVLRELRPELDNAQLQLHVEGAIRMLDTAIQPPARLPTGEVAARLSAMARAALRAT